MYKHIVKQGETLQSIAMDYRTSLQSILSANNLSASSLIYPGQAITIPNLPPKKFHPLFNSYFCKWRKTNIKKK